MKKLIKRLSRVADSSEYCLLKSESGTSATSSSMSLSSSSSFRVKKQQQQVGSRRGSGVPEGHLPVYVGEEMERFVVSAELLNHPIFVTLLNKSAQEYGYNHKGVLRIPCNVFVFERVLEALRLGHADLQDLFNSLSDHQDFL